MLTLTGSTSSISFLITNLRQISLAVEQRGLAFFTYRLLAFLPDAVAEVGGICVFGFACFSWFIKASVPERQLKKCKQSQIASTNMHTDAYRYIQMRTDAYWTRAETSSAICSSIFRYSYCTVPLHPSVLTSPSVTRCLRFEGLPAESRWGKQVPSIGSSWNAA